MPVTVKKLGEYVRKRDFSATAEPRGKVSPRPAGRLSFIVQKHDASRLHYDFRLEWDGVLLSWAITRGPSADPSAKRLAVRTEDHPIDYGDFEGTIPKKQYGGGTLMIWDRGWWTPEDDFQKGLDEGKLKFTLYGERMKGGWALVRMRSEGKKENWLLIKEHDRFEDNEAKGLTNRHQNSVASGRTMEEIADGRNRRGEAANRNRPKHESKKRLARPKFRKPQLATLVDQAPDGEEWLHETKFDGYRCLGAVGKGGARLYTRSGLDWTDRYAGLPDAFEKLDCRSALLDGEVVSDTVNPGSPFSALQRDMEKGRPVLFMAFDLLEIDGRNLTAEPLYRRKELLAGLLDGQAGSSPIRYSEYVVGGGPDVFRTIEKAGGEGIVSKNRESRYSSVRSRQWLKIKTEKRQEFVIGGFSPSPKKGRPFSSLLLGTRENGRLVYRGRVGTGFDQNDLENIRKFLKTRKRRNSPFDEVPSAISRSARWTTPDLVAEVAYAELTGDGIIRHGVFHGIREDKAARMVKLEKSDPAEDPEEKTEALTVLGVRISHPGRIVFPDAGRSKGDVARYYGRVAERMLDLAGDRPVSLLRCPDGRDGNCFFQKHAGKGFHDAVKTIDIQENSGSIKPYMVIGDQAGFAAAAQMGTLEFHIWGSRVDKLEKPDRMVFDLDPDEEISFSRVKEAAKDLRDLLSRTGLDSVPMVTGGKGIHVIVPLRRIVGWETLTLFSRTLANLMAEAEPKRFVATMSKAKRKGRIFVDWLRNDRGATAIAPYSIRARLGAPVAVPLTWEELDRVEEANGFDMEKAVERLDRPCPLRKAKKTQSISKAVVEALQDIVEKAGTG